MPRRSAYRICLPNFCADAATSHGMPRARRAVGDRVARRARLLVDERDEHGARHRAAAGDRTPSASSGISVRETPKETPTPGYVVLPSDASAS